MLTSEDLSAFYSDTGLLASTNYTYQVLAVSGAGDSPASAPVGAETEAAVDTLSVQPVTIAATRRSPFVGAVATFTDANTLTASGSFVATIHWGDGQHQPGDR